MKLCEIYKIDKMDSINFEKQYLTYYLKYNIFIKIYFKIINQKIKIVNFAKLTKLVKKRVKINQIG